MFKLHHADPRSIDSRHIRGPVDISRVSLDSTPCQLGVRSVTPPARNTSRARSRRPRPRLQRSRHGASAPCSPLPQLAKRSVLIRDVRGSNLREAANIDPWRNRNASVCKTVMSRGSTGRVIQDKQIARLWKEIAAFFHALVDQLDGQRISTPPYAGSSPVERTKTST